MEGWEWSQKGLWRCPQLPAMVRARGGSAGAAVLGSPAALGPRVAAFWAGNYQDVSLGLPVSVAG